MAEPVPAGRSICILSGKKAVGKPWQGLQLFCTGSGEKILNTKKHGTDIDRDRYFLYKVCFRYLSNVSLNTLYRIIRDRLLQADTDRQASKKQEMAH